MVKDAIHNVFVDLAKPKTKNRQVSCDEERKFKDSKITRDCYMKLNNPIDSNENYTYLTLVETIQFGQFLNCRKVAESWLNVCQSNLYSRILHLACHLSKIPPITFGKKIGG